MIDKLSEAVRFQQEALNLRHERQQVLAGNIANADTPNYKARDFNFAGELAKVMEQGRPGGSTLALTTTSARHIGGGIAAGAGPRELLYRVPEQPSLDGNTVDMDRERVHFADNSVRYQTSLALINGQIQGLKSALQSE